MKKVSGFSELDEEARKRMATLEAVRDEEIDFSDIPEWGEESFGEAVPFRTVWKPKKEQITARIDADVLLWLKSHGKGYQTLLNKLLRKEMMKELKKMA